MREVHVGIGKKQRQEGYDIFLLLAFSRELWKTEVEDLLKIGTCVGAIYSKRKKHAEHIDMVLGYNGKDQLVKPKSIQGGASSVASGGVGQDTTSTNIEQAGAAARNGKKTTEKPKPKCKFNKKKVNKNSKLKQAEANPTNQTQQFIGLYVCKELDGVKTLGTVASYDAETKLFKIGYDNLKIEHIELAEVLKIKATGQDIFEARQLLQERPSSEKKSDDEEEHIDDEEE
ncbi:unnamed protein product [Sphenostylis stenocarpa]|uniref:Uncharacterized protein n=1 Tax=Sphenostylis stenocarpa TaxID=92480 RepID=A0AA86T294_9FABA|nr:unnamed protein product [Sphenostylis stenocarpa]